VALLAGLERERDREVRLAGAGWAEEADVGALFDPGELCQVQHERLLGRGLGGPVEVVERLQGGEGGVTDAHAGAGGVAGEDLCFEQRLEKLLVGPVLGAGSLGRLLEPLQHPWCFQFREQVGQPLADLCLAFRHAQSSA
jgi:hypothetical protein